MVVSIKHEIDAFRRITEMQRLKKKRIMNNWQLTLPCRCIVVVIKPLLSILIFFEAQYRKNALTFNTSSYQTLFHQQIMSSTYHFPIFRFIFPPFTSLNQKHRYIDENHRSHNAFVMLRSRSRSSLTTTISNHHFLRRHFQYFLFPLLYVNAVTQATANAGAAMYDYPSVRYRRRSGNVADLSYNDMQ